MLQFYSYQKRALLSIFSAFAGYDIRGSLPKPESLLLTSPLYTPQTRGNCVRITSHGQSKAMQFFPFTLSSLDSIPCDLPSFPDQINLPESGDLPPTPVIPPSLQSDALEQVLK